MSARLEVRGLAKHFGGVIAADDVSFDVDDGECLGLIGPNGAGKTTVFAMIAGEIDQDAGTVLLDGVALETKPSYQRARRGLARTYQRLEVFPEMTVRDHLYVAMNAHSGRTGVWRDLRGKGNPSTEEHARADTVLEQVGLLDVGETLVGTLSLGSCRLVELARALVVDPRVLLADEPSSGLDSIETEAMGTVFQRLQRERGLSIVLVEHDLDMVASLTDGVVVMNAGKVIGQGPFASVMQDQAVRQAYLGVSQ